jgi:hypothetical protein
MSIISDFGFVVNNNQEYQNIYDTIYTAIQYDHSNQYVCFAYNTNSITHRLNVPVLPISQCKFFNGKLWISDTESLIISKGFTNINKIYFYAKDIPWLNTEANYLYLNHLYGPTQNLSIIAKNQYIYNVYSNCWNNKPIGIMENITYENFKKTILDTE